MSYLCNYRKRFHQSDTIWLDHHKHHKSYFSSLEIHVHFPLLYYFHDVDDQERRMMKETMVTERALTVDLVNVGEKEEDCSSRDDGDSYLVDFQDQGINWEKLGIKFAEKSEKKFMKKSEKS